jgi:hypothetical protein
MAKTKNDEGPVTVNISVLNDGTVSLVFARPVEQFTSSAEEMLQLGVNLIKASTIASMQQGPRAATSPVPAREM